MVAFAPLQTMLQSPQLEVDVSEVSHPFVSGAVLVQSLKFGAHDVYEHVVPLHVAPLLWVASHAAPHALQLVVVSICVSQPLVSGGVLLQSSQPGLQLVYVHIDPPHEAPLLWVVSHVSPQAPQLEVDPVAVSHPFVSGGVVSQSAHPVAQPAYWHVVPLHEAPVLWVVSQTSLHALQFVIVSVAVSQPFVSGAVFVQSAHPGEHPV